MLAGSSQEKVTSCPFIDGGCISPKATQGPPTLVSGWPTKKTRQSPRRGGGPGGIRRCGGCSSGETQNAPSGRGMCGQRCHLLLTVSGWAVSAWLTAGGLGSSSASTNSQLCDSVVFLFLSVRLMDFFIVVKFT